MTAKDTSIPSKTSAAKSEEGRVLKRKPRTATPKPTAEKKATKAKTGASEAKAKNQTKPVAATPTSDKEVIPGSLAALGEIFAKELMRVGKSEGTIRSYAADLRVAMKHFGEDRLVPKLTKKDVEGYFASDRVTLGRDGKRKNQITIDKVTRVFRQAIEYALAQLWMAESPLPEKAAKSKEEPKGETKVENKS